MSLRKVCYGSGKELQCGRLLEVVLRKTTKIGHVLVVMVRAMVWR